jgi:hypothetical protein
MTDSEMLAEASAQLIAANAKIEAGAAKLRDLSRLVDELWCYAVGAFVDGEFTGEKREAFCRHLSNCTNCQREKLALMQLTARLSDIKEAP